MATPSNPNPILFFGGDVAVSGPPFSFDTEAERDAWVAASPTRFQLEATQVDPALR